MRASVLSDWLAQRIERGSGQPVYRQLHRLLQQAILSRELPAGARVPSSRLLAAELGIARNTVTQVYEQLVLEGYVTSATGRGTFVADTSPDEIVGAAEIGSLRTMKNAVDSGSVPNSMAMRRIGDGSPIATNSPAGVHVPSGARIAPPVAAASTPPATQGPLLRAGDEAAEAPLASTPTPTPTQAQRTAARALSTRGARLVAGAGVSKRQGGAFMPGVPDVSRFPARIWTRLHNKYWRSLRPDLLTYAPGGGLALLRHVLADYLRTSRSVRCSPE